MSDQIRIAVLIPEGPGAHTAWESWLDRQICFQAKMTSRTATGEAPNGVCWEAYGISRFDEHFAGLRFDELVITTSRVPIEVITQARFYLR